jgi:hypothetical protein
VLARVAGAPGIARVIRPGEFVALGYPEYDANDFVPGHYLIASEVDTHIVIDPTSSSPARRPRPTVYHGHGYFPDEPRMHAALILSGRGIERGGRLRNARNIDVAPTIATLLDVPLPSASGRVLDEVLSVAAARAK